MNTIRINLYVVVKLAELLMFYVERASDIACAARGRKLRSRHTTTNKKCEKQIYIATQRPRNTLFFEEYKNCLRIDPKNFFMIMARRASRRSKWTYVMIAVLRRWLVTVRRYAVGLGIFAMVYVPATGHRQSFVQNDQTKRLYLWSFFSFVVFDSLLGRRRKCIYGLRSQPAARVLREYCASTYTLLSKSCLCR